MTNEELKQLREAKLKDIQENPDRHRHEYSGLERCCFVDGALDLGLMEAHEKNASFGYNGGRACDVSRGPCSCGAWH